MKKDNSEFLLEELRNIDMSSIALPDDKVNECKYFLGLASEEDEVEKFRWIVSAFFNAAYSFFEIKALGLYKSYQHPETGEDIEDEDSLNKLRQYVKVFKDTKRKDYVKTAGLKNITETLYELRRGNTHHYPLSITTSDEALPEGFLFGHIKGRGVPALSLCREVMDLISEINNEC